MPCNLEASTQAMSGRWRRPGPLILSYHGVGGVDGVSVAVLEQQLDALLERREVVPLSHAVQTLGRPAAGDVAALTFDDGYQDYLDLAVPVLASRSLHATLFVPAGHIGGVNSWDAGQRQERPLLEDRSLADLDPDTTDVGVHGYSHRRIKDLAERDLHREVSLACDVVGAACGYRPRFFAYPYGIAGDFDLAAERAVAGAGFTAACSAIFGRGSRPEELFRLRRVTVEPTDSLNLFQRKIDGAYDWLVVKERIGAILRRLGLRS